MATNNFKRLTGLHPANTTEAKLYGPTSGKEAIGEIYVCNITATDYTFRIAITDTDGAAAAEDWIAYDTTLAANKSTTYTFHLANPHTIRVRSSNASSITFVAMGNELTV